jgi:hypothetical protein
MRIRAGLPLLVSLLLPLAGCPMAQTNVVEGGRCVRSTQCAAGLVCGAMGTCTSDLTGFGTGMVPVVDGGMMDVPPMDTPPADAPPFDAGPMDTPPVPDVPMDVPPPPDTPMPIDTGVDSPATMPDTPPDPDVPPEMDAGDIDAP